MMKIKDKVYGEYDIGEEVIVDLINSESMQRLKKLSMTGLPKEYWHKTVFSRYEHSIGVFLLLRMLGASLTEQIAGLLHDVSHTAFSHVIDWVAGDPAKEDYQDNIHFEIIKKSNIPEILGTYGFDYEEISDLESFSLLDSPMPDLCADRFDYAIREIARFEPQNRINIVLKGLGNFRGKIVFNSEEAATIFSEGYLKCQAEHWGGEEAKARYYILSEGLKYALDKKIIDFEDFRKSDGEVINKLLNSGDEKILSIFRALEKGFSIKENSSGVPLPRKLRVVDPLVLINSEGVRLSEISLNYKRTLKSLVREHEEAKRFEIVY